MTQMHLAHELEPDLIDRLTKAIRLAGLERGELAARVGISRNSVTNYLAGRTTPSRPVIVTWALACGVPVEWLEHGTLPSGDGPGDGGEWAPRGSNPEPAVYELRPRLARAS